MFAKTLINGIWSSRAQLLLVVLILAFLSIGQGRELSLSLQGVAQFSTTFAVLSVAMLALQLWLWAYISVLAAPVSSQRFFLLWDSEAAATADPGLRIAASCLASGYSAIVLLFVMYDFIRIGEATTALSIAFTNILIVAYLVMMASGHVRTLGEGAGSESGIVQKIRSRLLRHPRYARLNATTLGLAALSLVSTVVVYTVWVGLPDSHAYVLGSFGSVFVSLAILIPWPFIIVVWAEGRRVPIVALLLLSPFVAETIYTSVGLHRNAYAVRELPGSETAVRPGFDAAVERWRDNRPASTPIVFVTAAGGGIRAAYWTAAVLGRLEDCVQNFHSSIFSISAVSGGSLGATAFATLVADAAKPRPARNNCDPPIPPREARAQGYHQKFLRDFLSQDHLAPVMRQMLLGDIGRSFVPWQSEPASATDRGIALEQAWEQAWNTTCDAQAVKCQGRFSLLTSFSSLSAVQDWLPVLFLNGVHEESGKRLMTSTLRVETSPFIDTTDFFSLVNHDVRTSTAILNSARFPVISPSGALLRKTVDRETRRVDRQLMGHVIDGGYFDNNGTMTSHEAAAAALGRLGIGKGRLGVDKSCEDPKSRRPAVFIEILNDDTMPELERDRNRMSDEVGLADRIRELASRNLDTPFHQLLTAVSGLESSRGARATHASKALARFADEICNGRYFVIPLCTGILPQPALGWMLSEESRKSIDQLLLGGIKERHERSKVNRDFYDCYGEIQRNISLISGLLAR